jgi:hypothetical protein
VHINALRIPCSHLLKHCNFQIFFSPFYVQYNGQFVFFDDRKGPRPVDASPIEFSHKDPIYDCAWLQSKTVTEILTCSTDGQVMHEGAPVHII